MSAFLRLGGAATLFVAVAATGHVINAPTAGEPSAGQVLAALDAPAPLTEVTRTLGTLASAPLPITDVTPTLGREMPASAPATVRAPADRMLSVQGCEASMTASPRGGAMALLAISAPCRAGERLTIQHDALSFTIRLDASGAASAEVPALSVDAVFFAFFDDASGAMAELRLPDVALYERAGIMWQGDAQLGLHASENGAPFGAEGYVWSGAPGRPARAVLGRGGFLVRLGDGAGDDAQTAEIYTVPMAVAPEAGTVEIAVEAAYGPEACGAPVSGTVLRTQEDGGVGLAPVSLALPDCDSVAAPGFVQLPGAARPITLVAGQ